jgi:hypothetical protein
LRGWALASTGRVEDGLEQMHRGLADFDYPSRNAAMSLLGRPPQGMGFMKSFLLFLLADVYGKSGRTAEGLAVLDAAWDAANGMREGFWKAEVKRLTGELLMRDGRPRSSELEREAEACFIQAHDIADSQGARSLQLRAAISLARHWRATKPAEAYEKLEKVYRAFAPGLVSDDLDAARTLLAELAIAGGSGSMTV